MTTEPKIAQTWEECAQHVEAGGVVEYLSNIDDAWRDDSWSAGAYRMLGKAPGEYGYLSRRLLPIEAPEPGPVMAATWEDCALHVEAGGVVERLDHNGSWVHDWTDVDYRTWLGSPDRNQPRRLLPIEAPEPEPSASDVPEGCEIVYLPTETIDFLHRSWCGSTDDDSKWHPLDFAIRDAVARRPGEKVHWSEAVGRRDMTGDLITKVTNEVAGRPKALYYSNNAWHPASDDGLIDVLVEGGES